MRKRWQINPAFGVCVVVAWLVLGSVGFIVTYALTTSCDADHRCGLSSSAPLATAAWVAIAVWIGPLVGGVAIAGIVAGTRVMWRERPRRICEPVRQDLREWDR